MKKPPCFVPVSSGLFLLVLGVLALPLATAGTSPQLRIITGAGAGGGPHVKRFDFVAPQVPFFPRAFPEDVAGTSGVLPGVAYAIKEQGVKVAVGDLDGDGQSELVTVTCGADGGPHVRLFKQPVPNRGAAALAEPFGGFNIPASAVKPTQSYTAIATYSDGTSRIIVGAGPGGGPHVKVFSPQGVELSTFTPYGPDFNSGIRVATGDVNGDGVPDMIVAAGPGGGPHIKIFNGTNNAELFSFSPYSSAPVGGINVAVGDVNGDGRADIITCPGAGAGPHVKIFSGVDFQPGATPVGQSHFAFDSSYLGGIRVATGDVDGDGIAEIFVAGAPNGRRQVEVLKSNLTGDPAALREIWTWTGEPTGLGDQFGITAGDLDGDGKAELIVSGTPGGSPRVVVMSPRVQTTADLNAFSTPFSGGVRVACGDVNGDSVPDIIIAAGAGGPPQVKVIDGASGAEIRSFLAFDADFKGGISVAAGDVNGDGTADIITGAGPGGGPRVRVFDGVNGTMLYDFLAYDSSFAGGVNVAAGDLEGHGHCDIITGLGPGGGPHVKVFDGFSLAEKLSFFAFDPSYTGGVNVAADMTSRLLLPNVGKPYCVSRMAGAGPGGGPHVKVYQGITATLLGAFSPFGADFTGGITVACGDVDGDGYAEVLAAASPAVGGPIVVGWDPTSKVKLTHRFTLGSGAVAMPTASAVNEPGEAPFIAISSRPVQLLEMLPPKNTPEGIRFAATGVAGTWLDFETGDDLLNWLPASSTYIPTSDKLIGLLLPAVQKRQFVRAVGK